MDFDFTLPGLGRPESSRPKRVAEAIKNELSLILLQKVSDPRLASVAISHVEVAPDLKYAKIYFTVPAGDHVGPVKKALIKAKGFFRSHLAHTMNLRYTPELLFSYDDQNEELERIDELFRQIEKDKKMGIPEQVKVAIQQADNLVLATHINPDGDAVGSLLGMMHIAQGMGKKVFAYLEEPVSPLYRFLAGCGHIQTDLDALADFVDQAEGTLLGIALDCGDRERLGKNGPRLLQVKPFLVIDHHQGNNGFGDITWVEPERSSTGEMIYDLAQSLGQEISTDAAECLYTAITTDTGSFKYESTSAHTMKVASDLIASGVQPAVICSHLYDNSTLGRLHLLQQVLAGLEMYNKDRIAVIRVTRNMLERTFTTMEDTEHFINLPRSVRSVRVAVFIKEADKHSVSVSMRAKGKCDLSKVAAKLGGGGHKNASGFRCHNKSIDEVRDLLIPLLQQEMA